MKKLFFLALLSGVCVISAKAQGGYTIKKYQVEVSVNKDASLNIVETIDVNFTESRHGIFRLIPFKYKLAPLPSGTEKADRQLESHGYAKTFIENIQVRGWQFDVSTDGDFRQIKIGSKDRYVSGDQQYVISYTLLNAINFFKDKSEFYLNIIGDQWAVPIDSVVFSVTLYEALAAEPPFFVATGSYGSKENNTVTKWTDNKIFSGSPTKPLQPYEGVTAGIVLPVGYLSKPDYRFIGVSWMLLPAAIFLLMFLWWYTEGKDDKVTITTEFYPPDNVSPSIAGYVIDEVLHRRDLTALIPYWGGGGYLKIEESGADFIFFKLKDLPETAMSFEKTLFNGIFSNGKRRVTLSSLRNDLYTTMDVAKTQLEKEVADGTFFEKRSKGVGCTVIFVGCVLMMVGTAGLILKLIAFREYPYWAPAALWISGFIIVFFEAYMNKKTLKGNELYRKLAGFKEFIKKVEKDRLQHFLKEDVNYFDKVLPFAIVFDMADTWKDKLAGLEVPQPTWYGGHYNTFNTVVFLNHLDNSMSTMTNTFYSTPAPKSSDSSWGSSGGSWSGGGGGGGGGGFSGGGFGGGGGGSW